MNSRKLIHEKYHRKTTAQSETVDKRNFTYRVILPILDKFVDKKGNILDIGCGAGTLSFYLANKGCNVTGIDISEKAIDTCKQTAKKLNINADFKKIDFPHETVNGKFDYVICSEVIEHLDDDATAIKQINKLMKKNATLILTTPSINAPIYRWGLASNFDKNVGHLRRYDAKKLKKMIQQSGFKIVDLKTTEGPLRNFLFVNSIAGKLVRFIKFFVSDIVSYFDEISLGIFGGSDIIVVAKKT